MLGPFYTFARCQNGVWERGQLGAGSPVGVVQGQVVLCFWRSCDLMVALCGMGALAAFHMVWAVFAQNLCQSLPLSRMKLVILRKAWYMTACWMGMVWCGIGRGCVKIDNG
jgi:hypothetical protein